MLLQLSIRDFVIVQKLELEFQAGFTALTGETGAGKSILIDALTLALGGRADADQVRAGAERAAINAPMQGTAADIIKRAMIDVAGWINGHRLQALMLMQVHDELVFEADADFVPQMLVEVKARMEAAAVLKVPLLVEAGTGANWNQSH